MPKCLTKVANALFECQHQGRGIVANGAYGGQCANDYADIGVEQTCQPGAARIGQCSSLGAKIVGQDGLNFLSAIRQLIGHVYGQLVAQLQHGAGQIVQQLLVLLRCFGDIATGV